MAFRSDSFDRTFEYPSCDRRKNVVVRRRSSALAPEPVHHELREKRVTPG